MYTYKRRVQILGDALRVPANQVIATLRRKNLHYCDAQGAPVLDAANWPDERLIEAAFTLFIDEAVRDAHMRGRTLGDDQ
jgi:hypothetical protein